MIINDPFIAKWAMPSGRLGSLQPHFTQVSFRMAARSPFGELRIGLVALAEETGRREGIFVMMFDDFGGSARGMSMYKLLSFCLKIILWIIDCGWLIANLKT